MIPATRDISVESTIQSEETIKYGVSAAATEHFMSILAGIYKDEARAVIREYTTNALDSHIEAGQTRPVELTLPTRFDKRFAVQDYGVGLSLDDLRKVYSQFGESTKRTAATDNQAGSLGIGSKVALAYSGQFQVVTVKDGRKIVALISLDDHASGQIEILSNEDTTEGNGVRVLVPVTGAIADFNVMVRRFAMFNPGKITIDGEAVGSLEPKFTRLDGDIYMDMDNALSTDYIVMGNVYYPVDHSIVERMHPNFYTVIYVPMRAVAFTPSREDLNYTRHTRATLDQYRDRITNKFRHFTEKVVADADNRREAFNLSCHFLRMIIPSQRRPYVYNGTELPGLNDLSAESMVWGYQYHGYCRRGGFDYVRVIGDTDVFLLNFNNARFTKVQAEKLELAGAERNPNTNRGTVILIDNEFDLELTTGCLVLDWEAVRKIKRPGASAVRKTGGGKRVKQYESPRNGQMEFHTPDTSKNIWYGSKSSMRRGNYNNWYKKSEPYQGPNDEFYYVTDTDKALFVKRYPNARPYREFHVPAAEAAVAEFKPEDFELSKALDSFPQLDFIRRVKTQLADPELVRIADGLSEAEMQARTSLNRRISLARELINKTPPNISVKLYDQLPDMFNQYSTETNQDLVARYPMFRVIQINHHSIRPEESAPLVQYLNSCYAEYMTIKESE